MLQSVRFVHRVDIQQDVPLPSGYKGPGDIAASAFAWWGLRAYSKATIGANAVRLREDGGNTEQNFVTLAPDGNLDVASIATFKGANNLFLVTFYDQTGNGRHLTQSTAGLQLPFILSGLGSLPVLRFSADNHGASLSSFNFSQPFTCSWIAKRTGNIGSTASLFGENDADPRFGFSTANNIFSWNGVAGNVTAADNAFHAVQIMFGLSGSYINLNGTETGISNNASTFSGSASQLNQDGILRADFVELGFWASAFSSGTCSSMSSNQHTYWGF